MSDGALIVIVFRDVVMLVAKCGYEAVDPRLSFIGR
jgi:hypothetical protein